MQIGYNKTPLNPDGENRTAVPAQQIQNNLSAVTIGNRQLGTHLLETFRIPCNQHKLEAIKVIAPGASPGHAVLFVHGMWSNAQMFAGSMQTLAEHNINSYCFSQAGHGNSSGSEKKKINYSLATYESNLRGFIEHLAASGISDLHLAGHSLGGFLVQKYLLENPSSIVKSVSLIAPAASNGILLTNLRFFLKHPLPFLKCYSTLDAFQIVKDKKTCAKALFSCLPEQMPKDFKPDKSSFLANLQACLPILQRPNKNHIPVQLLASEQDNIISHSEIFSTAKFWGIKPEFFPGSHMGIIEQRCNETYLARIASFASQK
jgi:alpha-beta hydrolase superfamily lysophospholipase